MNRALPLLVLIALLAACGKPAKPPEPTGRRGDQPFPVEVAPVREREIARVVQGPGALEAFETVEVAARVNGVLDRLLVTEGDRIAKGAAIAEIDGERYRLAVASAEAQLARAAAALEDAKQALARREDLAKTGMVAAEVLDQTRIKVRLGEADLAASEAAAAKARLDLHDATVTAPIGGVIQRRNAATGAYLQVGTPLVTLVQREPLQVRFHVAVAEAPLLKTGQPLRIQVRGSTAEVAGTIRLVSDSAETGTRQVVVVGRIDDGGAGLWPGAFAEVSVDLPARTAVAVPALALRTTERGLLAFVVVDGKAVERQVVTGGHAADGTIEIVSGLKAGEQLVVRAADGLVNGKAVKLPEAGEGKPAKPGKPATP